jgi:hypothetical protein
MTQSEGAAVAVLEVCRTKEAAMIVLRMKARRAAKDRLSDWSRDDGRWATFGCLMVVYDSRIDTGADYFASSELIPNNAGASQHCPKDGRLTSKGLSSTLRLTLAILTLACVVEMKYDIFVLVPSATSRCK